MAPQLKRNPLGGLNSSLMPMHPVLRFSPLFFALIWAACASSTTDGDIAALGRLQQQVDSAVIGGDVDRYLTFLTDDAVLMPPNGPAVVGKEAIGAWNREMGMKVRILNYASRDDEVVVAGDWALRSATFEWTIVPVAGGDSLRDSGKYVILYRRDRAGEWRVARDIWNTNTNPR